MYNCSIQNRFECVAHDLSVPTVTQPWSSSTIQHLDNANSSLHFEKTVILGDNDKSYHIIKQRKVHGRWWNFLKFKQATSTCQCDSWGKWTVTTNERGPCQQKKWTDVLKARLRFCRPCTLKIMLALAISNVFKSNNMKERLKRCIHPSSNMITQN